MEELALDRDRDDQVVCGQSYAVLRGEDGTLALSGHNGKTRFTSVATSGTGRTGPPVTAQARSSYLKMERLRSCRGTWY